ncbi:hypothetical protein ACQP2X_00595 [Actinoplanes sp. CA-131856]
MPMIIGRAAAALLLAALPVTPAAAAPSGPTADIHLTRTTLAPGGSTKSAILWMSMNGVTDEKWHHVTLSVDQAKAATFAELDLEVIAGSSIPDADGFQSMPADGPCRREASVVTCEWDDIFVSDEEINAIGYLIAKPTARAKTGDSAELELTARVDDGPARTTQAVVRVGQAVDLAAGRNEDVSARPGGSATVTPMVRNPGATAVEGAVMVMGADSRLLARTSYRNCLYGEFTVICRFGRSLEPGAGYRLSAPITMRPPAGSAVGSEAQTALQWVTPTEWDDIAESLPAFVVGTYGSGAPLALEEAASVQSEPQSDVDPENDSSVVTLRVTGDRKPDLGALGAHPSVAVGEVAATTVGMVWRGPGRLRPDLYPNNAVPTHVRLPGNVTLTEVADNCLQAGDADSFTCYNDRGLAPGQKALFTFGVELDEACGAAGAVEVGDMLPRLQAERAGKDDNHAPITVTAPNARCALPITGPGVPWTAGAGAALVAVGLLLAVRRRRPAVCAHAVGERWPG